MPQPDINSLLIINQAIGPTAKENILTVHLDLDVFSEQGWKQDHEAAWCFLEQLHNRSNQSFESFITDKTRELFK